MEEFVCAFCGIEMKHGDSAYGITRGAIDESFDGFRIDEDSDWDVYCPDCINEIDRLLADHKRMRES